MSDQSTDDMTVDAVPMTEDGIPLVVNGQSLTPMQIQALREAKLRKAALNQTPETREINGADRTTDPTRYGDWEKAGRAVDFS